MPLRPQSYSLDRKTRLSGRRKAVTFILGVRCVDGLVLAADSLESDGVTKRSRKKLEVVWDANGNWSACWGGSGTAEVIDKFSDKLKLVLKEQFENKPYNRDRMELYIEQCLGFVRQQYPREKIHLSLGLFGRPLKKKGKKAELGPPETHLYRGSSETGCISLETEYCAVGMDVTLATFILNNTYFRFHRVSRAKRLAVFVIALMKEYADGVGKETRVFSITHETMQWEPLLDREISEIESKNPVVQFENSVSAYIGTKEQEYFGEWMDEENKDQMQRAKQLASKK